MLYLVEHWFFKKIKLLTSINVNYYKIALIQILSVKIIYIKKKRKKKEKIITQKYWLFVIL